jgi:hypothetical protein
MRFWQGWAPPAAEKARMQPATPHKPLKYNDSASLLFALIWSGLLLFAPVWRYFLLGAANLA